MFEGAGIGKGELVLTISQNGTNIASTSVFMDLHDIKDLYERATANNVTDELPPDPRVSSLQIVNTLPADPTEPKRLIVFAHGMNQTQFEYENSSETMFKRLYWSGYQGRFTAFRWHCGYLPPRNNYLDAYDVSEYYSWKSAAAFKDYMTYLRNNTNRLAGYSLNIIAHSQGNIMTSEALKQGAPFDNYILTQAAAPAHSYDTNTNDVPYLPKLIAAEGVYGPTPFAEADGGYDGYFTNIAGNLINFYNTNDFALASGITLGQITNWEEDQRTRKPENFNNGSLSWQYGYSTSTRVSSYYSDTATNTVTDAYEKKAMVARARSHAIGANNGAHGVIVSSFDLFANLGVLNTRPEHSAQFTRPVQTIWGYYDEVLISFGMPLTVTR